MDLYILVSLGLCLLTLGVFGYLMSSRFAEQNTKISAMADLIQTVVQDVQMIKISHTTEKLTSDLGLFRESQHQSIEQSIQSDLIGSCSFKQIVVSDAETISDDDSDDDTDDDEPETYKDDKPRPSLIDIDDDRSDIATIEEELYMEPPYEHESVTTNDSVPKDTEIRTIVYPSVEDHIEKVDIDISDIQIKLTDILSSDVPKVEVEEVSESINLDSIVVEDQSEYNKLDVVQLRKLVTEKKLSTAPTKLKKKELISILISNK